MNKKMKASLLFPVGDEVVLCLYASVVGQVDN